MWALEKEVGLSIFSCSCACTRTDSSAGWGERSMQTTAISVGYWRKRSARGNSKRNEDGAVQAYMDRSWLARSRPGKLEKQEGCWGGSRPPPEWSFLHAQERTRHFLPLDPCYLCSSRWDQQPCGSNSFSLLLRNICFQGACLQCKWLPWSHECNWRNCF